MFPTYNNEREPGSKVSNKLPAWKQKKDCSIQHKEQGMLRPEESCPALAQALHWKEDTDSLSQAQGITTGVLFRKSLIKYS